MGSVPLGEPSELLVRNIGEKKAREMWYLCRTYTAHEALEMGLINSVVPPEKLEEEVAAWCREILEKSPTALRRLKIGFNSVIEHLCSWSAISSEMTMDYWKSEEAQEALKAHLEKKTPDFSKFRK